MKNFYKEFDFSYAEKCITLEPIQKINYFNTQLTPVIGTTAIPVIDANKNNVYQIEKTDDSFEIGVNIDSIGTYTDSKYKVKCRIPVLMPLIPEGDPKDVTNRVSKNKIEKKNKDFINISDTILLSNYIMVDIPSWIIDTIPTSDGIIPKGQEFIIVLLGGDINNIKVIGRH